MFETSDKKLGPLVLHSLNEGLINPNKPSLLWCVYCTNLIKSISHTISIHRVETGPWEFSP